MFDDQLSRGNQIPDKFKLNKLNNALEEAVHDENYEVAAILRDKIQEINKASQ